jgi:PAS domain S-box-containing protein
MAPAIDQALHDVFPGNSEMAQQMRAHDWAATPLGDPLSWPENLRVPLRMLLTSRFEMWLGWGDDLHFFYNDAYIPTLGIKHPAMLGKPFHEVWAEVYEEVADQVAKVRAGEATWNEELLLLLERSGHPEETYHSFSYSPLYGAGGAVDGLLCIVSEQTERVIAARRLETLRQLGMALVGTAAKEEVREALHRVLEANRRDFPFALIKHPRGVEVLASAEDAILLAAQEWPVSNETASRFELDAAVAWPRGAWQASPREALAVPIPGPGDEPDFGVLILALNPYRPGDLEIADFARLIAGQVSGALANSEALDSERRRADRIWSHSRDLIVVVDAGGIFRAVSPSWTQILGHDPQDVVGRPFADFIVADDLASSIAALATALSEGDLTGYENRFRARDGGYRWLSWHTAMEKGLVYAYGRDVTEQKQNAEALAAAEDALRQAQKMEAVGQLTGGIAHDFNNLLTGIIGSLDLMKRKAAQGRTADVERYAEAATASAHRAAALTQRLLAFSRRQPLDPKVIQVGDLIAEMVDLIRQSIGEAIEIVLDSPPGTWPVKCDPNQLESAILNLAINARDAMPGSGRLSIEIANLTVGAAGDPRNQLAAPGEYVAILVRDTGHGMDAEVLGKVFEPFFTTKPIGAGTGLGLSMIYGFARQSEGFVTIESTPGLGTAVSIHLPRATAAASVAASAAVLGEPRETHRSGKVLVVEDEPAVRALVVDALQDMGHEVIAASDGQAGFELLSKDSGIDLLVTDVGLPGLNGRQLADAGRVLDPELKILFMTGYAHNATGNDADWLGWGMEVITKPFAVETLAERVQHILQSGERVRPALTPPQPDRL